MASNSNKNVPAYKLVQQAVHDYYIRTPDADKMFNDAEFERLLETVAKLDCCEDDFKDLESYPRDNTTYPLSDDPYEIIKSSFPSTCPDDLSMSQYWLLQDVVDKLPSNRQEGSRPLISDETGMRETEQLIDQMKAVRHGGRSGGACGFVVGVLGGWINHGLDCKRVGTQAGEITAKDLHEMEVRPGHPLSPRTIFRAGMYVGRSGYAGGGVVAAPGGNAVGRAVGGVIGGSVGYTGATGKALWRGITSLF